MVSSFLLRFHPKETIRREGRVLIQILHIILEVSNDELVTYRRVILAIKGG